jgi:uncharacterized membrane protein
MKTTTGLKKEIAAALSYILGPISGLIFLVLEKDPFIRYHAMQSIVGLGALGIGSLFLGWIPFVGMILWLVYVAALLMGAYQASQGVMWEMPVFGKLAKKFLSQ